MRATRRAARTVSGAAVAILCAVSVLADVKWPTETTCRDGNLASTGEDGWGRALPVAEDVTFAGGGTYTVYLENESIALATNVYTVAEPKVYGTFAIYQYANKPPHATFDIRNHANLLVRNLYFGFNSNNNPTDGVSTDFVVRDGSSLHALDEVSLRGGVCSLVVTNGSALTTDGRFFLHSTSTRAQDFGAVCARLRLQDSVWTVNGNAQLGNGSCPATIIPDIAAGFTNSVIDLNSSLEVNFARVSFKDCEVDGRNADGSVRAATNPNIKLGYGAEIVFDGGIYENLAICPGYGSGLSAIRLNAGQMKLTGLWMSPTPGADAIFEIDGETAEVHYPNSRDDNIGFRAKATVSLVAGLMQATSGGFTKVGVGNSSYKTGIGHANISGGTWILNAPERPGGFYVGENGEGHVSVSGGFLAGNYVQVVSTLGNSDFKMTGGHVRLDARYGAEAATTQRINTDEDGRLQMTWGAARAVLDGGVIEANGITGGASSELSANGGMVRVLPLPVKQTVSDPFIGGFGSAVLGVKGLTIDTDGHDANVTQSFADSEDAPGEGRLIKAGAGTLTLAPTSYGVAKTIVEGGTLAPGVASLTTELVLTNRAAFSLVGEATAITLSALSVPNGRLELDPGDTITVTGTVDLDCLQLSFSSTPSSPTAFLTAQGMLSEKSQAALRRALYVADVPAGRHGEFMSTYDAGTGNTTVTLEIVDNVGELSDLTAWQGATGAWSAPGNWSAGVPTSSKKALFADDSPVRSVETTAGALAGAVAFGADGYVIGGTEAVEIAGEPDAAHIDVTAGTNAIVAPLVLDSLTRVVLDLGTELRLSGAVKGSGIEKSGKGRLVLSNPKMECPSGVELHDGTTVATCRESLGTYAGLETAVTVTGGTLEVNAQDGQETVFDQPVSIRGADNASAIVLKSETPAAFENLTRASGAIIKRGRGKLTLGVHDGATLIAGNGALQGDLTHDVSADQTLTFADDGSSPTSGYGALTVAEGELCVKPANAGETPAVTAKGAILVGNRLYQGVSNPTLTIDHVDFDANHSWRTMVGLYINDAGCRMTEPTLRVVNGAKYYSDVTELGRFCNEGTMSVRPTLIVEDSTFKTWLLRPTFGTAGGGNMSVVRGKNATFEIGGEIDIAGNVDGDFDNCVLRGYTDGSCLKVKNTSYGPGGFLRFRNGSVFCMNSIRFSPIARKFAFVFDDASWDFGAGDFTLRDADSSQFASPGFFSLEMEGAGLTVRPASGKTLTLDVPVGGEGGFVLAGEGTVAFGAGRYGFSGPLTVQAGVVDLSSAGVVTNAVLAAGAGTILGGDFRGVEIRLGGVDGPVPHFRDVAFSGRSYLSVAGVSGDCDDVKVATYEGSLSLRGSFRIKGQDGYRAVLTARDGEIHASIGQFGFRVLVR